MLFGQFIDEYHDSRCCVRKTWCSASGGEAPRSDGLVEVNSTREHVHQDPLKTSQHESCNPSQIVFEVFECTVMKYSIVSSRLEYGQGLKNAESPILKALTPLPKTQRKLRLFILG